MVYMCRIDPSDPYNEATLKTLDFTHNQFNNTDTKTYLIDDKFSSST